MFTRDDFEAISNEEFDQLKSDNESWQTGDMNDCEDFVDMNNLKNFELYRTNIGETIYMVINNETNKKDLFYV